MTVLQPTDLQPTVSPGHSAGRDLSAVLTYDFPSAMLTRLQQQQGWDTGLTLRALNEYRRFIVLAMTAPHPVTPSQLVDEVWHTHVLLTRDYWERLTPLLPAPLHHEPGDGSPGDDAHFAGQYERTLDLYQQTFGQPAPAELWPDPRRGADTRRGEAAAAQAPAEASAPAPSPLPRTIQTVVALVVAAVVTGLSAGPAMPLFSLLALIVFGVVFALVRALLSRVRTRPGRQGDSSSDLNAGFGGGFLMLDGWGGTDSCSSSDSGSDSSCGDSGGSSCGSSCGGGGCSS